MGTSLPSDPHAERSLHAEIALGNERAFDLQALLSGAKRVERHQ